MVLLCSSDLTQLGELTQHKYTKPLRRKISYERVIFVFATQVFVVRTFRVITMSINDFLICGLLHAQACMPTAEQVYE